MTEAATHFIGAATLQALTGKPVLSNLWGAGGSGMDHIHASRSADLIVVAPASADFMAKLAQGRADDLLSTLCLARACPLMLAPAMNREMWANPATQRNIAQLRADSIRFIGPDAGEQACGEIGLGRMSEPQAIFNAVEGFFGPKPLAGKTVLITAGPTFEPIDPVRGLTNLSSGKMGYALAAAAREAGAQVILVSGPTCLDAPAGIKRLDVTTAQEMFDAVMAQVAQADIFISVAAVADYRIAHASTQKIKKSEQSLTLELTPNKDILASVAALSKAALSRAPFCVGFAAETENLLEYAEAKRQKKQLPMLVANRAQDTLGQDTAELVILDKNGQHPLPRAGKTQQAHAIIQHLIKLLP
jgi:phosphopantothenoylcysteine decarboxylase/phosphopantothenate--cysteine ligase